MDVRRLPDHLHERPERDSPPVRKAPAAEHEDLGRDAGLELLDQARLADTRVTDHGDEPAHASLDGLFELREQQLEFACAADEGCDVGSRLGRQAEQAIGGHRLRLPLQLERLDRLDLDGVADEPVRLLADQDLESRRRLLEPRGDVDRVAR